MMMKHTIRFVVLAFLAIVVATSCKRSVPKQTKYIPKDAFFVYSASPRSLMEKLSSSKLSLDSLFQTFAAVAAESGSAKAEAKTQWENVKASGIDFSEDIFGFVKQSGSIMSGQSISAGMIAVLKDASAFEAFLKKEKAGIEIKKDNDLSYADLSDGVVVGWKDDMVIAAFAMNKGGSDASVGGAKQLNDLFAQKEEESVASIPEFKDLLSQKGDMKLWSNSSGALANIPFIGMTKASDLFKDSYTGATLDFEDGKAVVNATSYSGKDLRDILSKYSGPTIDRALLEKYPSQNVNGFALFSFNPQLVGAIIKFIGLDTTVDQYLNNIGFSLDEILKAFKGDFAIIGSDFAIAQKPNPYYPQVKSNEPSGKFIFTATMGEKAAYEKVTAKLATMGWISLQDGHYTVPMLRGEGVSLNLDEKALIVSNDSAFLLQYKAGAGKANIPSDISSTIKGKTTAFYLDVNGLLKDVPTDSSDQDILNSAKASFKDIIGTSDGFDGKSVKGEAEFRTINDKENSLVTILNFAALAAKAEQQRKAREPKVEDVQLDGVRTPADSSAVMGAPVAVDTTKSAR